MLIEEDKNLKMTMIWLTKMEQNNPETNFQIEEIRKNNKIKKYRTAVFVSGKEDLFSTTEGLLLHNSNISAKRDLEKQRREELNSEENQGFTLSI